MPLSITFDTRELEEAAVRTGRAIPPAQRAVLKNLALQVYSTAMDLATGSGPVGSYPIPEPTGHFRRSFGFESGDDFAIVWNDAGGPIKGGGRAKDGVKARGLHNGFIPFGNPHARPIPPRPYFSDALSRLDLDAATRAAADAMERGT